MHTDHAYPSVIVALVDECGVVLPQIGALVLRNLCQASVAPQLVVGPRGGGSHVDTVTKEVAPTL